MEEEPLGAAVQVLDDESDELGVAEGACEAGEEERAIALAARVFGARRTKRLMTSAVIGALCSGRTPSSRRISLMTARTASRFGGSKPMTRCLCVIAARRRLIVEALRPDFAPDDT